MFIHGKVRFEPNECQGFVPFAPGPECSMVLNDGVDIAPGTHRCNSRTTESDALWMEVPLAPVEGMEWRKIIGCQVLRFQETFCGVRSTMRKVFSVCVRQARMGARERFRKGRRMRLVEKLLCDAKTATGALEKAFEAIEDCCMMKAPDTCPQRPSLRRESGRNR
jgi:hypothetical protein